MKPKTRTNGGGKRDFAKEFPILKRKVNGKRLVYVDNAATAQKPAAVIAAEKGFYENNNANIHRAVHQLSQEATAMYDAAREKVKYFINASSAEEIIFTRGATESFNLILYSYALPRLKKGDEIILSRSEHHSNLVPWLVLAEKNGVAVKYLPFRADEPIRVEDVRQALTDRTRMVSIAHVSNVLGMINPVEEIGKAVRQYAEKAKTSIAYVIDAAQSAPHLPIDVQAMQADFLAFSGHKMYGPTGIGVLYGRKQLLEAMEPFNVGSDMIHSVSLKKASWNSLPFKFEAGTQNIAGAIGLGAAVDYLDAIGMDSVLSHEQKLARYAIEAFSKVKGLRIYGLPGDFSKKIGVISFNLADIHPHDMATILDEEGIAIRSGHHCAQPLMDELGVAATCRVSLGIYNTKKDIDAIVSALGKAKTIFKVE